MKKRIIWMCVAIIVLFAFTGIESASAARDFTGEVTITPEDPIINIGDDVILKASWSTNKDVTRYEWEVDGTPQGENTIPDDEKQSGSRELTFSGADLGDHEVCFYVWHHAQEDRYADNCVTITVNDPPGQVCTAETAWADGDPYNADGRGNWATYTPYFGENNVVTLYAGQTMEAGTVEFSAPENNVVTITIQLNAGWQFKDGSKNVKIQGYDLPPSGNPSPGSFDSQGYATGSSFDTYYRNISYYGVHVDVEQCEME